jgi:hypothetical protein
VSPNKWVLAVYCLSTFAVCAQQAPQQPQVKLNVLNVCTPSAEEQKEISSALGKIPKQPLFGEDFEIDRGRSTLPDSANLLQPGAASPASADSATATWVRIRRELAVQAMFSTVQYSFSLDAKNMVETLVFRVRDPKDLMQVSIEDSASAVTSPGAMLTTSTPASRIKLERFGKSSVVLARCSASENGPPPDQSAYEPLFKTATNIVTDYRHLLAASSTVPAELARINRTEVRTAAKSKAAAKKPPPK